MLISLPVMPMPFINIIMVSNFSLLNSARCSKGIFMSLSVQASMRLWEISIAVTSSFRFEGKGCGFRHRSPHPVLFLWLVEGLSFPGRHFFVGSKQIGYAHFVFFCNKFQ
jgi:hypothetical protein